jgi:Metallopeptidase family M24
VSIDDEVVHGIPGGRAIREGQLVSIDAGAIVDGWHGDGARTFIVGDRGPDAARLVETTRLAMMAGIAAAVPGARIGDISAAIEDVAKPAGYGIVRQFVGHGIGTEMHEGPQVPNYRTGARGMKLVPGICLAIEPMLTLGSGDVLMKPDGWTIVTAVCRDDPCLIRYAFVCRSAWTGTRREKGILRDLWPSVMRSRWRERSSSRCPTRCSPSSWRMATGSWPTSAASCG